MIADGQDLLAKRHRDVDEEGIRRRLIAERGNFNPVPLLLEEAILPETDPPRLPLEFKCHIFGEAVGAIQIIQRGASGQEFHSRYYDPGWRPFEKRILQGASQLPVEAPPPYLDDLLGWSKAIGSSLDTYIRMDFLGTATRCVFNEFSSIPGTRYNSPFMDEVFGALWNEHIPDKD